MDQKDTKTAKKPVAEQVIKDRPAPAAQTAPDGGVTLRVGVGLFHKPRNVSLSGSETVNDVRHLLGVPAEYVAVVPGRGVADGGCAVCEAVDEGEELLFVPLTAGGLRMGGT